MPGKYRSLFVVNVALNKAFRWKFNLQARKVKSLNKTVIMNSEKTAHLKADIGWFDAIGVQVNAVLILFDFYLGSLSQTFPMSDQNLNQAIY